MGHLGIVVLIFDMPYCYIFYIAILLAFTKTYDGEEIKIVKFEESQGKVKAIYNKGLFFAGIDIDGLEAPKQTMRPGVDIGGSFEKMKANLAEMVKKAMAEMYDGRDNLTNISDDTK